MLHSVMKRAYGSHPVAAVGAVVVRDGAVLLVRRGHAPLLGAWTLPGGAIALGETGVEALRRELKEECNIEVAIERVLDVVDLIESDEAGGVRFHYVIVEFLARYLGGELRAASDAIAARFAPPEALRALGLSEEALRVVRLGLEAQRP